MNNLYAVLGVLPGASPEEIKASYRQLVKRYHPDIKGGNAWRFKRIRDAYEVLSNPERRKDYDEESSRRAELLRRAAQRREAAERARARAARPGPRTVNASDAGTAPVPLLTRLMSIAVPRSGRFQLQGLIGNIVIQPTTAENLWETTRRKFSDTEPERLARHVIQIKLSGERDLVKTMMPRPTDFGVEFQRATEADKRSKVRGLLGTLFGSGPLGGVFSQKPFGLYGSHLPLTLQVTVPKGVTLYLADITGMIQLGDLENEVVAKLLGGTMRAGRVKRVRLTLNGASQAYLSRVEGPVDLMGFGDSRAVLDGSISRLRVVLENAARCEVRAPVDKLQAEVNGNGQLEIKNTVDTAQCDVRGTAQLRIARVTSSLQGTRSRTARVNTGFARRRMGRSGIPRAG